jgi:hypothetical protein
MMMSGPRCRDGDSAGSCVARLGLAEGVKRLPVNRVGGGPVVGQLTLELQETRAQLTALGNVTRLDSRRAPARPEGDR